MDSAHIAELIRGLRERPSRRAVAAALVTLGASTALAPLLDWASVAAKKKKKKKKKKLSNDEFCKKAGHGPYCKYIKGFPPCCGDGEVCVDNTCHCCPADRPNCCAGPDQSNGYVTLCCAANETCCHAPNGSASCCAPGQSCCGGQCCGGELNSVCCGGVACCSSGDCCTSGVCCSGFHERCCPDGRCLEYGIAC